MTVSPEAPPEGKTRGAISIGLLAGVPVLLLALWGIGGLNEQSIPGLPVVPVQTLWALPLDLWIRDTALAFVVGFALVGGVLAPTPDPRSGRLASLAALVFLTTLTLQCILTVSEVLALPLRDSVNPVVIWSLLTQTTLGRVILIQFIVMALVAVLAWVVLGRWTGLVVSVATIFVAFLSGFIGHSGIQEGHLSATISLGMHVVAASIWIGGLVATVDYVRRPAPAASVVLRRFSTVALICVIVLAQTGLVNASLRIDGISALITSVYGALLLGKIMILIILIGYGRRQRQVLGRALDFGTSKVNTLFKFSFLELVWMGSALGLSVALSRAAPPGASQPADTISFAAVGLLGLGIPLAIRYAIGRTHWPEGPRFLREYPEAVAVALVATLFSVSSIGHSGTGDRQLILLFLVTLLLAAGLAFWTALNTSRPVIPACIVGSSLPVLAWWISRNNMEESNIATWLACALCVGILCLGCRRQIQVAPVKKD